MPLLLVRHAVAVRRKDWPKADHLRPLTPKGYAQAEGIAELLRPYGVTRILSSPFVRCVETVEPLSDLLGIPVETVDALAEGSGASAATFVSQSASTIVMCSHGDVIPELLDVVAADAELDEPTVPCAKGSMWVVDLDRRTANYLPPPESK